MTLTSKQAQQIGEKQTLLVAFFGLSFAYLIWSLLAGFLSIFESPDFIYILVGILLVFIFAYFFGGIIGVKILLKKRDHTWWGFLCAVSVIFSSVLVASLISYFAHDQYDKYLWGPILTVFLFPMMPLPIGLFVILFFGFWLGKRIKMKGERLATII